jgi:hypothetical protein
LVGKFAELPALPKIAGIEKSFTEQFWQSLAIPAILAISCRDRRKKHREAARCKTGQVCMELYLPSHRLNNIV